MASQPAYRTRSVHRVTVTEEPEPAVPMTGSSDVLLHLPVSVQVRLAAESLLTGRPADDIAAEAIAAHLRRA